MTKGIVKAVMAGILLGTTATAWGGLIVTLVDTEGDPHRVTISAGSSFDVIVQVDTSISLSGLQLQVKEVTETLSGAFRLNSVDFFCTPPEGLWDSDPQYQYHAAPQVMDEANDYASGYMAAVAGDVVEGTGTGTFNFVLLNLTFDGPDTYAEYRLNLSDIVYGDLDFDEHAGTPGEDYMVIIPEPVPAILILIGLGAIGLWPRRRA